MFRSAYYVGAEPTHSRTVPEHSSEQSEQSEQSLSFGPPRVVVFGVPLPVSALDPFAEWDPNLHGTNRGGVTGGCMGEGSCAISPRLVAIPVFDPDAYNLAAAGGRTTINVVKVLVLFIDRMQGNDVGGWITTYPSKPNAGMGDVPGNNFVVSVALVR